MRYLCVPLSTSRIFLADCQSLLDKVEKKLSGWKAKILSYAGKLELIR